MNSVKLVNFRKNLVVKLIRYIIRIIREEKRTYVKSRSRSRSRKSRSRSLKELKNESRFTSREKVAKISKSKNENTVEKPVKKR